MAKLETVELVNKHGKTVSVNAGEKALYMKMYGMKDPAKMKKEETDRGR